MHSADHTRGTFVFPGPAVFENADTFIEHFMTAPVEDSVLRECRVAYSRWADAKARFLAHDELEALDRSPEFSRALDQIAAQFPMDGLVDPDTQLARANRAMSHYEEQERAVIIARHRLGVGPEYIGLAGATVVVRAAQMSWMTQQLDDPEEQQKVLDYRPAGRRTVEEIAQRWSTDEWIDEGLAPLSKHLES